jgi:carbon starvation protein
LVSSGTTSKQLASAGDAQLVGYGSMLGEGMLAVVVVLACCAGVGMGKLTRTSVDGQTQIVRSEPVVSDVTVTNASGVQPEGSSAWRSYYRTGLAVDGSDAAGGWKKQGLDKKLAAFIDGGANFLSTISVPLRLGVAIMAVMVACFAATTLDTATRLQRYVISELATTAGWTWGANRYVATTIAVGVGLAIAIFAGDSPGTGGLILWPLFGATNQLLAGLALMVAVFYLARRNRPIAFLAAPMMLMLLMPAWAMTFDLVQNWWPQRNWVLITFGVGTLSLQAWMVCEAIVLWRRRDALFSSESDDSTVAVD